MTDHDIDPTIDTTADEPIPYVPREPSVLRLGKGLAIHGTPAQRTALFAALARAQGAYLPIHKTKTVKVRGEKASYDHDYAPLDEVIAKTRPALAANGCALLSVLEDAPEGTEGDAALHTLLTHEGGAFIHASEVLAPVNKPQDRGIQITYKRRYQTGAITGTASETDDDGGSSPGAEVQALQDRKPAPKAAPAPLPAPKPAPAPKEPGPIASASAHAGALSDATAMALRDLYASMDYRGPAIIAHTMKFANCQPKALTEETAALVLAALQAEKAELG